MINYVKYRNIHVHTTLHLYYQKHTQLVYIIAETYHLSFVGTWKVDHTFYLTRT